MSDELADLRAAVDAFPAKVSAQLRAVAWRYSRQAMALSKQNLQSVTTGHNKEGHQETNNSIVVIEQADQKQFIVTVENPDNPMLGNWIEYGTRKMSARPFMRPASDALNDPYGRDMLAAANQAAESLVK
jgi:HK97 gp10 family phage protein